MDEIPLPDSLLQMPLIGHHGAGRRGQGQPAAQLDQPPGEGQLQVAAQADEILAVGEGGDFGHGAVHGMDVVHPRIPRRCRRPSTRRPKNSPSMNSSRGVRKLVTAPNTAFFSAEA